MCLATFLFWTITFSSRIRYVVNSNNGIVASDVPEHNDCRMINKVCLFSKR